MKSITQMINEGKKDTFFSMFKDDGNSMLSMIAKRIENWDKNSGKHSQEPMFLCDWNFQQISWATLEQMNIEVGDEKGHTDGAKNVGKGLLYGTAIIAYCAAELCTQQDNNTTQTDVL